APIGSPRRTSCAATAPARGGCTSKRIRIARAPSSCASARRAACGRTPRCTDGPGRHCREKRQVCPRDFGRLGPVFAGATIARRRGMRFALFALLVAGCGGSQPLTSEVVDAESADTKEDAVHPNLTATQQKQVRTALDNICGDTWCDGDWNWTFEKVTCKLDLGTCTWTALVQ